MKLFLTLFLLSSVALAAPLRISINTNATMAHKFSSQNPTERISFIGLNLDKEKAKRHCIEPKFVYDAEVDAMVATIEGEILSSSWYSPAAFTYSIKIYQNKFFNDFYSVSTTLKNNGKTVKDHFSFTEGKPFSNLVTGTTYEASLHDENVDRISVTPAIVFFDCL